jgi:hypothetical protein
VAVLLLLLLLLLRLLLLLLLLRLPRLLLPLALLLAAMAFGRRNPGAFRRLWLHLVADSGDLPHLVVRVM